MAMLLLQSVDDVIKSSVLLPLNDPNNPLVVLLHVDELLLAGGSDTITDKAPR